MEAGFLGAAAAPEPQERPAGIEQKRARPVLNAPPAIRGRRDFPGVDSGKNLHAAAAASHSERCGHGHGETMRTRTLPARSARPPHPSRTPFPTFTPAHSSLTYGQTQQGSMIQRSRRNTDQMKPPSVASVCQHVARVSQGVTGWLTYTTAGFHEGSSQRRRAASRGALL